MTNNPLPDRNLKQHSILRESENMKKASEPNCDLGKETQQYKESVCVLELQNPDAMEQRVNLQL
jgi:hypothetical protein